MLLNFHKNGDFINFAKNIFANGSLGNIKGVAWQYFAEFNFATAKSAIFMKIKQRENFLVYGITCSS